ncbi:hypothetical protein [Streptomyces sp. NPDC057740]|uniref:hypothetical protein n=1 Tax=Streptomyces sp. NPDC057740 TaxID=3346234 RepID=UPI0036B7F131
MTGARPTPTYTTTSGATLEAGLLPQLLTDPGLFVHADPVPPRVAVEAAPIAELASPARRTCVRRPC